MKTQLEKSSFKRKIQAIVRRPQTQMETGTKKSPYDPASKDEIIFPICICSGMFLDGDLDWTFCPNSKMPALLTQYKKYTDMFDSDPLNGESITSSDLRKVRVSLFGKIHLLFLFFNALYDYFFS